MKIITFKSVFIITSSTIFKLRIFKMVDSTCNIPASGYQVQALDKRTFIFTFHDVNAHNQIQVLYVAPRKKSESPLFGLPGALIERLNTPNDLQYSEDRESLLNIAQSVSFIQKFECIPVPIQNIFDTQMTQPRTPEQVASSMSNFLQKYYSKPSLPYRCPRLSSFKSILLLLFISFSIKLIYAFTINSHYQKVQMVSRGDDQFHRRWQQLTINLPVNMWWVPSSLNHWTYCFLDYPIITAYMHWLMGKFITQPLVPNAVRMSTLWSELQPMEGIQHLLDSEAVDEYTDPTGLRRYPYQTSRHHITFKYFFVQRMTFLFLDTLLLGSSSIFLALYLWRRVNPRLRFTATLVLLLTPLAILIDHGNPQVNFLTLSFFLLAVRFALSSHFCISACLAILSVFSKVTALSVMLPFAVLVVARFHHSQFYQDYSQLQKLFYLVKIGLSALGTFLMIHLPFLGKQGFTSMMIKIFPLNRYITEQPLPNLVRFISFRIISLIQVDTYKPEGNLLKYISNILTLLCALPSLVALARRPTMRRFIRAIQLNALSYNQVAYCLHEKAGLWFAFPMAFSLVEDPSSLYLSSNILTMFAAYCVVSESNNFFQFWSLLFMQLILALFHSQSPKPLHKAQQAYPSGLIKFMNKGVNRYLPAILLATIACTFHIQGDKWETEGSYYELDRIFSYVFFAYFPLWCYLYLSITSDEKYFHSSLTNDTGDHHERPKVE